MTRYKKNGTCISLVFLDSLLQAGKLKNEVNNPNRGARMQRGRTHISPQLSAACDNLVITGAGNMILTKSMILCADSITATTPTPPFFCIWRLDSRRFWRIESPFGPSSHRRRSFNSWHCCCYKGKDLLKNFLLSSRDAVKPLTIL